MEEEMGRYAEDDYSTLAGHGINRPWVENIPHTKLIRHFLERIGVSQADFNDTTTIGARFTADMIRIYEQANSCEGLAVIGFAIEQTVPTLYQYIWDGLKSHMLG